MIQLKPTVNVSGLRGILWRAVAAADEVFEREGVDTVITSARDGQHMPESKHYKGEAVDLRSKHLPSMASKLKVLEALRVVLGPEFDVLLEARGVENEHFHVEFDPK